MTGTIKLADALNNQANTTKTIKAAGSTPVEYINTVWDDLRFPVAGINPPGAATDPSRNTTTGLLEFSASQINTIAIQVQMPHPWALGTSIIPHIHLIYPDSNAGNSVWRLSYDIAKINANFAGSFTTDTKTFASPAAANRHALHAFGAIDMTTHNGLSVMIIMLLERLGNDGADTYAAALPLLEFDIHYEIDTAGSAEQTSKT